MEIVDSRNLAPTVKSGNYVTRVTKHNKTTNKIDTENKRDKKKKKEKEAEKEEKEAEKEERRERKREKNRRKRVAYRLRQQTKKASPKPSKAKREEWKKEHKESNKEYRKEKKRKQKGKQRKEQESRNETNPARSKTHSENEWTKPVEQAGDQSEFESLLQLFSQHLDEHRKRSGVYPLKSVLKRFRELSTRYHPDKHTTEAARYGPMFQALNEARGIVVDQIV
ncbi:MAG: hypothetical protein SGBAC_012867 [Bacillariaceae sp.]